MISNINDAPIRIAQIMGKWIGGGVEAVVMNYYRHIDRNKIQFDFFCDDDSTDIPYDEIQRLGGRVTLIPPYQKVLNYHKTLKKLLIEGNYQIVHSHINTLSVFSLCAAKAAKVPVRIAHSHSTSNKSEWKKNIVKNMLRPFSKVFSTHYFACTEHAARYLFGNKTVDEGNVYILNNAIDLDKFEYNQEIRDRVRKELNISDNTFVIGHVGRFVEQKNHKFLIDIFNEFHKKCDKSKLLLIGQGPLEDDIKNKVKDLTLNDFVCFLGQRKDVNDMYQAFDLLLFPSLYEGLGIVVIESQVNGLPCICSDEVPEVVNLTNLVKFISLNLKENIWAEELSKKTRDLNKSNLYKKIISDSGYNIHIESKKLIDKYLYLLKKI